MPFGCCHPRPHRWKSRAPAPLLRFGHGL